MQVSRRTFLHICGAAAVTPLRRALVLFANDQDKTALCRKLASDPLRPQYHLLPAHNWMNDPNGPIYFRGRYHMFYQYNPQGAVWGNMHWAHATSPDLIHWYHEPIALSPTPGGPDQEGVFSGSAVLDGKTPTMIYTGVAPPTSDSEATLRDGSHTWREAQCLAVAQDGDLRNWKKLPEPIIAAPPPGLPVTGFRDPCVWRENDRWMLILGSGIREKGGVILLYSSFDLRHWTYLHPLLEGSPSGKEATNPVDTGDMWECPDFFPLANKHVLLISTMGKVHWKVGSYNSQRFTPESQGVVDWGSYYAAKTMLDRDGNRILWGWIPETRPDADLLASGWAGVMSLPRVLSIDKQNRLVTEVAPVARQLRTTRTGFARETSSAERGKVFDAIRIHDLAAEFELDLLTKNKHCALLLQSPDGRPFASIAYESATRELTLGKFKVQLPPSSGSAIHPRIFLDGSVLEVFANQTTALTARVYQVPAGPLRLRVLGDAEITSLNLWQMKPISNDRLTGSFCN